MTKVNIISIIEENEINRLKKLFSRKKHKNSNQKLTLTQYFAKI